MCATQACNVGARAGQLQEVSVGGRAAGCRGAARSAERGQFRKWVDEGALPAMAVRGKTAQPKARRRTTASVECARPPPARPAARQHDRPTCRAPIHLRPRPTTHSLVSPAIPIPLPRPPPTRNRPCLTHHPALCLSTCRHTHTHHRHTTARNGKPHRSMRECRAEPPGSTTPCTFATLATDCAKRALRPNDRCAAGAGRGCLVGRSERGWLAAVRAEATKKRETARVRYSVARLPEMRGNTKRRKHNISARGRAFRDAHQESTQEQR